MTNKITQIYQSPIMRKDIAEALAGLDVAITEALDAVVDAGVPLILAKSVMETHVTMLALQMVRGDDEDE